MTHEAFPSQEEQQPPKTEFGLGAFHELNTEQQERAVALMSGMAEKFNVAFEDFAVLKTTAEDGSDLYTVAYTADNGIDLGDPNEDYDPSRGWNSIFAEGADQEFTVMIDGQAVDTRTGMTEAVYEAFIAEAIARGVDPLPDSLALSHQNDDVWTDTLLTGEETDRDDARMARVAEGRVRAYWSTRAYDGRGSRFRPAAAL